MIHLNSKQTLISSFQAWDMKQNKKFSINKFQTIGWVVKVGGKNLEVSNSSTNHLNIKKKYIRFLEFIFKCL